MSEERDIEALTTTNSDDNGAYDNIKTLENNDSYENNEFPKDDVDNVNDNEAEIIAALEKEFANRFTDQDKSFVQVAINSNNCPLYRFVQIFKT